MTEFRVFLRDQCLINPPPQPVPEVEPRIAEGLLALLVPGLIEAAIKGVANALRKAGEEKTETLSEELFVDLYKAKAQHALVRNPDLGCVLAVWFDPDPNSIPTDDDVARTLKQNEMVPEGARVGGVFEGLIRHFPDGTAFFLDVRHFSVSSFISSRWKGAREYVVTLTVSTPDATTGGSAIAVGGIDLGRCERKDSLVPSDHPLDKYPRYWSNLMPWSKISEASRANYERDLAADRAAGRSYMPVTLSLSVSETTDGNKFLMSLGEFLSSKAEEASKELAKQVLPVEREKTAAEEAARIETIYEEELAAELEVRRAQKAYDEGPDSDKPTLKVELEIAIRKRNWRTRLREAAGLPVRPAVPPG